MQISETQLNGFLEELLDNVGGSIYVRDRATDAILFTNQNLRDNFAKELEEGSLKDIFEHRPDKGAAGGPSVVFHEARNRWYERYYKAIRWIDGSDVTLIALYDATEKKLYRKKVEIQIYTDFLTGLSNRICCERELIRYIDEAMRKGTPGAMLYIDLDDFKHINDGLGHQCGDELLRSIAGSLRDIPGIHNTCYRVGGDEFVVIVEPAEFCNLERIKRDITEVFEKSWYLGDADYYSTMSMGVVEFPADGKSVEELIRKADIAMYEAKEAGKNRIVRYSDDLKSVSTRRLDMEKNMRDAAVHGYDEFEVYYQPVIDIQKEDAPCVGAEALIRWNSSHMGFLSPTEFIPLAEYLGLINPIGTYVAQEACRQCKAWNDMGLEGFHVNVNLSVVQLMQADIVDIVKNALDSTGIKPENLTLEITESVAINDLDVTREILDRIRQLGVKLALDDFGTGYSSLSNIKALPFDLIKVDQSFVKDLAEDNYSKSFIRMVAQLAEAIGAEICVEGVETRYQYRILEDMNVKYIQGFYFNHPLSKDEFEALYVKKGKDKPRLRQESRGM